MLTAEDQKILDERFSERYVDEFGKIYTATDSNFLICEFLLPYTPIDEFMNLLRQEMTIIEMYGCDKSIIDLRATRGFHQPSMEWYHLTWKQEMYEKYGLSKHRQILPDEDWFVKCVEASNEQIKQKDPGSIVHTLDISTCYTLEEAVNS